MFAERGYLTVRGARPSGLPAMSPCTPRIPVAQVARHGRAGVRPSRAGAGVLRPPCWRAGPRDAYALASRAHVLAQARPPRRGASPTPSALVAAHPQRSAGDWFNLASCSRPPIASTRPRRPSAARSTLDPKLDRAWYGLGLALIRQQRFDEAVAALKRNTELQPMSPYGWYQLARVQVDRQRARGGAQDHPPPEELRAEGGRAAGARDGAGAVTPPGSTGCRACRA